MAMAELSFNRIHPSIQISLSLDSPHWTYTHQQYVIPGVSVPHMLIHNVQCVLFSVQQSRVSSFLGILQLLQIHSILEFAQRFRATIGYYVTSNTTSNAKAI